MKYFKESAFSTPSDGSEEWFIRKELHDEAANKSYRKYLSSVRKRLPNGTKDYLGYSGLLHDEGVCQIENCERDGKVFLRFLAMPPLCFTGVREFLYEGDMIDASYPVSWLATEVELISNECVEFRILLESGELLIQCKDVARLEPNKESNSRRA